MHRKRQKSLDQALLHLQRLRWSAIQIKNMIFNCSKWFIWYESYHMSQCPFTVQVHLNCNSYPVTLLQYPKTPQLLVQSDKSFYLKWRPTSCAETQKYFTYNVLIEHMEIPYQRLKINLWMYHVLSYKSSIFYLIKVPKNSFARIKISRYKVFKRRSSSKDF